MGVNDAGEYTLFVYNANNQLSKLEYYEDGQKEDYTVFEYTNDLLTTAKEYDAAGSLEYTSTYKYDSNKRLIEQADDDSDYITRYTYDSKGNKSTEESLSNGVLSYRLTYENYDDKFSPYWGIKGLPSIFSLNSKNNPGKVTDAYDRNGDGTIQPNESEVTTYTYKYNDKGFATEITETDDLGSDVSTYTYECN